MSDAQNGKKCTRYRTRVVVDIEHRYGDGDSGQRRERAWESADHFLTKLREASERLPGAESASIYDIKTNEV